MPSPQDTSTLPRPFGPFMLTELLGVGGMAQVFAAYRVGAHGIQTPVAVKSILPALADDPTILNMFIQEAAVCARLRHPNIVATHEFNECDGLYYLQMEIIDGCDLKALFDTETTSGEGLPLPVLLEILHQLCAGLAYVHGVRGDANEPLKLVHRDLKPSNVFINRQGVVKVGDFGLAKGQESAVRTATGRFKGTLVYMAPEQLSDAPITQAVDIFSLGLILYRGITGERLIRSTSIAGVVREQDALDPKRIGQSLPDAYRCLKPILRGCLERDPTQRFQSGQDLLQALQPLRRAHPLDRSLEAWMGPRWPALDAHLTQSRRALAPSLALGQSRASAPLPLAPTIEAATDWTTMPSGSLPEGEGTTQTQLSPTPTALAPQGEPRPALSNNPRWPVLLLLAPALALGALGIAHRYPQPSIEPAPAAARSKRPALPPTPTEPHQTQAPEVETLAKAPPPTPSPPPSSAPPAPMAAPVTAPKTTPPKPQRTTTTVTLTLSIIPRDGKVVVDGSPPRAVPWVGDVTPGPHRLAFICPGDTPRAEASISLTDKKEGLGVWDCNKGGWFKAP